MTALLSAPARRSTPPEADPRRRRPLLLVGALGGGLAAGGLLVVCLGLAVTGWFLTDAASHGAPRDALRVGALGWLTGHGSGVRVEGVAVTAVPLLITLLAAWSCWRVGQRVGHSVSGHGPDADQISDGERDWTVPVAVTCFALGYVAVTLLTLQLAATTATAPATAPAVGWSLLLAGRGRRRGDRGRERPRRDLGRPAPGQRRERPPRAAGRCSARCCSCRS